MIANFIIINNSEHMNNQNEKQHKCDKKILHGVNMTAGQDRYVVLQTLLTGLL